MALEVEERKKSVIYVRQQATAVIAFIGDHQVWIIHT